MSGPNNVRVSKTDRPGAGFRCEFGGWIYLRVEGAPYDRGWHHGFLLADEIRAALHSIAELLLQDTGLPFEWYASNAEAMWRDQLYSNDGGKLSDDSGRQIFLELQGIVDGANDNSCSGDRSISLADLLGWNGYPEMICHGSLQLCRELSSQPCQFQATPND